MSTVQLAELRHRNCGLFNVKWPGGGVLSWKTFLAVHIMRSSHFCSFPVGEEKNKHQWGSYASVDEMRRAKQEFLDGTLSFTAGRTSLTRLAARGSRGLLYRNDETRHQWSHPPLPSIHPKRLWVALATCEAVCVYVSEMSGGLRNHRVKMMCHQRGLRAHGLVKGVGSFSRLAWRLLTA